MSSSVSPVKERLNVLFITADQWRGNALSCKGHPVVKTPNIDELVRTSVSFDRHFAQCVPCGPSRSTLHTGLYLHTHKSATNGTPLDSRFTNWALEARKVGYDPVLFGYTDITLDPRTLTDHDPHLFTYQGVLPGLRPVMHMGDIPTEWGAWLAQKGYSVPSDCWELYTPSEGRTLRFPSEHSDTAFMAEQALEYMQNATDPFFVHLSLLRPHPPWIAPRPYDTMYPPSSIPSFIRHATRQEEASAHPWLRQILLDTQKTADENLLSDDDIRKMAAVYYGLLSEVDAQLGRVFKWLRESGDHHLLGKIGFFDQSYHIPLVIRDPTAQSDHSRGTRISSFTEHVDIMPTLLDWIGVQAPAQCEGTSLMPFIRSSAPSKWRSEVHWEYDFRNVLNPFLEQQLGITMHQSNLCVVRGERYKYVHFAGLPPLFYDLLEDPGELYNLATQPQYLSLVLEYAQKMLSWRMTYDDASLAYQSVSDIGLVERICARS